MPESGLKLFGVLAIAVVLLLAGIYIGVAWQDGWSLTSTALTTIIALLLIVFAFAVRQNVQDGQPMPEAQRRFLALYLVSICIGLVYMVFALMTVRFPDAELVTPATAPTLPASARPANDAVAIAQVVPNPIRADLGPVDLQVFGYNFAAPAPPASPATGATPTGGQARGTRPPGSGTPAAGTPSSDTPTSNTSAPSGQTASAPPSGQSATPVVHFRELKTPRVVSDQLLVVPLTPNDVSMPGPVTITVVGSNGTSASTVVRVLDVTGELHVLRWRPQVTREMQLLLLAIVAGALGSYVHAIRSLTAYIGNQQAVASWFWFYITKPFLGVALAVVFYAAIRGGFVAGSPADVKSVNPFGVFAVAALVGMFADKAGNKLAEIFDALFRSASERQNPISSLAISTASLPNGKAGNPYSATVAAAGGTPPYTFGLVSPPAWLSINQSSGALSGTPPSAEQVNVQVTVVDAKTSRTGKTLPLTIA